MKRIRKVLPAFAGLVFLIFLGVGLSGILRNSLVNNPVQGGQQEIKKTFSEATLEAPVSIGLKPAVDNEIPTLTPRPQPTRDPAVTLEVYPVQSPNAVSAGSILYIEADAQPRVLSMDTENAQVGGLQALALDLAFSPLIGPASADGRYLVLLQSLEPGGIPYILERDSGRVWPLLQGHPQQSEITGWAYGWHPNNQQVLFWSFNAEALWLVHAETGAVRALAVTRGNVQGAALSPDGLSVVYINPGPDSTRAMWKVSTAGGDARVLFDIGGPARVYSFSPDGKAVLYAAPGGPLWVMDPQGKNRRPLKGIFVFGGALAPPTWSPDGQWVAFTGLDAGEVYGCIAAEVPDWDTCRYEGTAVKIENIQTGEIKRLTAGIEPVWLRDGSGLVFLSNRTDVEEVWFINPAGDDLRQLTADGASKSQVMNLPE